MKRYLAIFGFVFIGVIAGLIVRGIPIVLQVQAGGGIQADRNGDVNGDARLDMSDAVYLLLHSFRDGPQPVALAQAEPADLRGLEGSMNRIADSLDNLVVLEQGGGDPLTRIADALERQDPVEWYYVEPGECSEYSVGSDLRSGQFAFKSEEDGF